jgi:putative membrane protein
MDAYFTIMMIAASLAALFHVFFFLLESVLWTRPAVKKIFRRRDPDTENTRVLAFNQGFYNLFLALGNITGICMVIGGVTAAGLTVIASGCSVMLGAAIVLFASSPKMIRGALIQGIPPLVFLVLLILR